MSKRVKTKSVLEDVKCNEVTHQEVKKMNLNELLNEFVKSQKIIEEDLFKKGIF